MQADDDDVMGANAQAARPGEGNVVYLGAGARPGGGGERVASGAGEDTIGVSGNVLAFGRASGMRFLDGADSGLVVGGAGGAALPGGLGSVTLFGGLGAEALTAGPMSAEPITAQDAFGLGVPDVIGSFQPGVDAAAPPGPSGQETPAAAGASTLHLPDGTTVMMLDLSKLTGSSLL